MKWSRLRNLLLIAVGATVFAQLATRLGNLTGIEALELSTLDLRQQTAARQLKLEGDQTTEVVIVFFDEESVLGWPYEQPFPRAHLADLIEVISAAGATTIGVDVFFEKQYPALNAMDNGDERLRRAIEQAGNVVLLSMSERSDSGLEIIDPDPYFGEVAAEIAAADLPTPYETFRDGVVFVRSGDVPRASFALALWAHSRGADVDDLMAEVVESGSAAVGPLADVPGMVSDNGDNATFPLRYIGPPSHLIEPDRTFEVGTFQATSSTTVLQLATAAEFVPEMAATLNDLFRDRIVLMGSGFHAEDKFRTPFYNAAVRDIVGPDVELPDPDERLSWMYGVELHAHAVQNMIDAEYVRPLSAGATWVLLFGFALLAGGMVFWGSAVWGAVGAVALSGGLYFSQMLTYATGVGPIDPYLWVPIIPTFVALWVSYLGSTAFVAIVEGKDKRFLRNAFGKYVSPAVVGQITENPDALKLGGQKRTISVLFSDLAGFTSISERMSAEELIAILNEYLTEMTQLVMDEAGTLDKYIGDAIMAFWNAPQELPDHADRAVRCAVLMQRKMTELNERWMKDDPQAEYLVVRIGINTGDVVVGNVGGTNRFDYSAIGDPVNLGARLEPANKDYDTLVMISQYTLDACRAENFRIRELDFLAVKGKEEPVPVYEVLELAGVELSPEKEEALLHYEKGMEAYRRMDWELASTYFAAAAESDPSDGPSRVYLERSNQNVADPPPADWDFVVRKTTK